MMRKLNPRMACVAGVVVGLSLALAADSYAVTVVRNPVQGAGFVDVDGGLPLILGAPVGDPLQIDFVFEDMRHIELMKGATTNIEFGIGNTGNNRDLSYRIVFDLSDMNGNLITNEALVLDSTAPAGFNHIVNLDLTPLPEVVFHDFHIQIDTHFADGSTGDGLFDFYVAGGGGDPNTGVSGPIRFNRAVVGEWVPEPATVTLGLVGLGVLLLSRRRLAFGGHKRPSPQDS
jgi:PEP-CTERM motif